MPSVSKHLLPLRIIAAALMVSVMIYGAVVMNLQQAWTEPPPDPGILPTALTGLSIAMIPVVLVMRKTLLGSLALVAPPLARSAEPLPEETIQAALKKAMMRYRTGTIVAFALTESIAVYGLVAAFVTQDAMAFLPNAAVALLMMAIQFPRSAGLLSLLEPEVRASLQSRG